jgi:hypothetical protein
VSITVTVTVSGTERRPRFHWPTAAAVWAADVRPLALTALKARAPVGKGPTAGKLRDSIGARIEPSAGRMWVVLYSTDPVARFVVGGTRPHVIMPHARTRGGWTGAYTGRPGVGQHSLHWVAGGGDVFAWKVNHPGTKPDPFPERAIAPLRGLLMERFAKAAQEAML